MGDNEFVAPQGLSRTLVNILPTIISSLKGFFQYFFLDPAIAGPNLPALLRRVNRQAGVTKKVLWIGLRGFMLEIKDLICVLGMVSDVVEPTE